MRLDILKPLESAPIQAYFSNRVQIADVMDWVIDQIGPAEITITTFSTSEEFIRRVVALRAKGKILKVSLFCDIRAARKTLSIYDFIKGAFDDVFLCENHSKVLLFRGSTKKVAIITSQNQTRGDRFECGVISTMADITAQLESSLLDLQKLSRPLNELIKGTARKAD